MHIKTSPAPISSAIGIIGSGLAMFLPEQKWIGLALMFLGSVVFFFDISIDGNNLRAHIPDSKGGKLGPIFLMILGALFFISGAIWYYSKQQTKLPEIEYYSDGAKKADSPDTNEYVKDMQFNASGTLLQGSGKFARSMSEIGVFAEYSFHSPRGNPNWSENGYRFEIGKLENTVKNGYVHIDVARDGVNQNGSRNIYIGDPAKNYPLFPGQNRIDLYFIGPDGQEQTLTVYVFYSGSLDKDALTLLQEPKGSLISPRMVQ